MRIRLKYFSYPQFQTTLLLSNVLSNLIVFGFIYSQIHSLFLKLEATGQSIHLPENHVYFKFIEMQQSNLRWSLFLVGVLSILGTSILTLWFSHRLAGPLVRLKKHLVQTVEQGYYKELIFRSGDYFSDLPEILNTAFQKIQKNERQ